MNGPRKRLHYFKPDRWILLEQVPDHTGKEPDSGRIVDYIAVDRWAGPRLWVAHLIDRKDTTTDTDREARHPEKSAPFPCPFRWIACRPNKAQSIRAHVPRGWGFMSVGTGGVRVFDKPIEQPAPPLDADLVRGMLHAGGSRREARPPREVPIEDEEMMIDETADPERSTLTSEMEELLWRLMEQVPEDRRYVVAMYELEEQPVTEIAVTLGISELAVRKRLERGRQELKAALTREQARRRRGGMMAFSMAALFEAGRAVPPMPDTLRQRVGSRIDEAARSAPQPSPGRALARHAGHVAARAARHGPAFLLGGAAGAGIVYALLAGGPSPKDSAMPVATIVQAAPDMSGRPEGALSELPAASQVAPMTSAPVTAARSASPSEDADEATYALAGDFDGLLPEGVEPRAGVRLVTVGGSAGAASGRGGGGRSDGQRRTSLTWNIDRTVVTT